MTVEEFKIEILPLKNKLFRFAKRLLRSYEEAEDTVQEVFLRLWSKRENLVEYKNVEAFAMTVTKNICLDKIRSGKNRHFELNDHNLEMNEMVPDKKVEIRDTVCKVHQLIDNLPENQRLIIQLRDIEGYEFEEIAEITGSNFNAIRVNLSRARKKVRDELIKTQQYEFSEN